VVQLGIRTRHRLTRHRRRGTPRPIAGVEPAGDLGLLWAADEVALVGVLSADEVVRRTGRSLDAVRKKRHQRGRPNPARPVWPRHYTPGTAEHDVLLRTLPPAEVSARTGHPLRAVDQRRHAPGITTGVDG
jgi:hypothetical protein